MASDPTRSAFAHPFAASYKAGPGQLPCFSLQHSQPHHPLKGPTRGRQHSLPGFHPPPAGAPSSNPPLSNQSPAFFCPKLAGERDRDERKRISSHPALFGFSTGDDDLPEFFDSTGDESTPPAWIKKEKVASDVIPEQDTHHSPPSPPQNHFRQFKFPFEHLTPGRLCRAAGIFFQPPPSLDPAWTRKNDRQSSSVQTKVSRDASDERFELEITRAVVRGDSSVDLANQGICSIPASISMLGQSASGLSGMTPLTASRLFQAMNTPSTRQSIGRVRSAPPASISPCQSVSLILSNNYLSSASNLDRLCQVKGLQRLILRSNQLTELPEAIGTLTSLLELQLSNNQLCFLPSSIHKLIHCRIYLSGNPWMKLPSEGEGQERYVAKPTRIGESIPKLSEFCLKKLCKIRKDAPPCSRTSHEDEDRATILRNVSAMPLPDSIRSVILEPDQHFKRCCCGEWRLEFGVECFEWTILRQVSDRSKVPIRWWACREECLRLAGLL